ncbi:hypothetical protein Q1695_005493 [Nippostrongylus brasiliensis]|nr:hypothetical protein Q1695_005493 [Nippostrongylus brasiliensis]
MPCRSTSQWIVSHFLLTLLPTDMYFSHDLPYKDGVYPPATSDQSADNNPKLARLIRRLKVFVGGERRNTNVTSQSLWE